MGYITKFYGVDLDRVRNAIANHDRSVIETARRRESAGFASTLANNDRKVRAALIEIVNGTHSGHRSSEIGHLYGYGFKLLCGILGKRLPDQDMIGDLASLGLQSPLEALRSPVDLTFDGCFPYISYLGSSEVHREFKRLQTLDLFFPDADIENGREAYENCIRQAMIENLAVIAFYH